LVVEGAQYSGSAITAKLALDQGRELFAVPGNITSKTSWGPNLLIKQGAKLVQEWNDVVTELPPEARRRLIEAGRSRLAGAQQGLPGAPGEPNLPAGPSAETGRWVLKTLKTDSATHIDVLLDTLENSSPSELIAVLFELEMMGLVKQLPGKNFVKVW
jgi:DNA processing protein